jgi:hypothetical protein
MPATPQSQALARRMFQSDVLDAHVSLADLRLLSYEDLVRLGQEVRQRLQVLDAELPMFGRQCETASHGVSADICLAMADLKQFLSFFEERVMHHRLRLRRAGKANPVGRRTAGVHEVA